MREFNLKETKNGAPVCTRDGRKARIICFDRKHNKYPIVVAIEDVRGESIICYGIDGKCVEERDSVFDLFMYEKPEPQFKPFDKVLVRYGEFDKWHASLFSHIEPAAEARYMCVGDCGYPCCIPYNGNEYLLGTTDKPKED